MNQKAGNSQSITRCLTAVLWPSENAVVRPRQPLPDGAGASSRPLHVLGVLSCFCYRIEVPERISCFEGKCYSKKPQKPGARSPQLRGRVSNAMPASASSLIEQAATSVTAMGTAARRREFGNGCCGSGANRTRFRYFNKILRAGSERVPVKFVMVSIHREGRARAAGQLQKTQRHLLRNLTAEPVCLHQIHRRQKSGLAKYVGHASGACAFNASTLWLKVSSSNAAAASANRMRSSES